jgi:hypothetical protein
MYATIFSILLSLTFRKRKGFHLNNVPASLGGYKDAAQPRGVISLQFTIVQSTWSSTRKLRFVLTRLDFWLKIFCFQSTMEISGAVATVRSSVL